MKGQIVILILLCLVNNARGEPRSLKYDRCPCPMGGMEVLKEQVQYPAFPGSVNWETSLTLSFRINPDGTVMNMQVLESGGELFDQAAVDAVYSVAWQPATIDGQAVPVRYELPFRFSRK